MFSRPPQRKIAVWYGEASPYKPVDPRRVNIVDNSVRYFDDVSFTDSGGGAMAGKTVTRANLYEPVYQKSGCREPHPPHSLRSCSRKSPTAWNAAKLSNCNRSVRLSCAKR